jgi:hypothetical protein
MINMNFNRKLNDRNFVYVFIKKIPQYKFSVTQIDQINIKTFKGLK